MGAIACISVSIIKNCLNVLNVSKQHSETKNSFSKRCTHQVHVNWGGVKGRVTYGTFEAKTFLHIIPPPLQKMVQHPDCWVSLFRAPSPRCAFFVCFEGEMFSGRMETVTTVGWASETDTLLSFNVFPSTMSFPPSKSLSWDKFSTFSSSGKFSSGIFSNSSDRMVSTVVVSKSYSCVVSTLS